MNLTWEKHKELNEELFELELLEEDGEITKEERGIRTNKILQKLNSYENYYEFDDFNTFSKEYIELAKKLNLNMSDIHKNIEHESQHAEIDKKYNLPTTYCFKWFKGTDRGDGILPNVYVKNINKLQKGWSDYKVKKYEIEVFVAPTFLSESDKNTLISQKGRIEHNQRLNLNDEERKEFIKMIDERLKKKFNS